MASLEDVFNHLVLPPRLPGRQDADIVGTGDAILVRLIQAANTSIKLAGLEQESTWLALRYSLRRFQSLHVDGRLEKQSLISEFRNLNHDESILFHIAEQNAALIIRCNARYEYDSEPQHNAIITNMSVLVTKLRRSYSKRLRYRHHLWMW